jgi:hypothetical protein
MKTLQLTDKQLWNLARAVTFMKRKCVQLTKKDPDDEVMKNNVATFTELEDLIDDCLDDDKYGWNFVTQQGEEDEDNNAD